MCWSCSGRKYLNFFLNLTKHSRRSWNLTIQCVRLSKISWLKNISVDQCLANLTIGIITLLVQDVGEREWVQLFERREFTITEIELIALGGDRFWGDNKTEGRDMRGWGAYLSKNVWRRSLRGRRWSPPGHRRGGWSIWSGLTAQSGHVKSVRRTADMSLICQTCTSLRVCTLWRPLVCSLQATDCFFFFGWVHGLCWDRIYTQANWYLNDFKT